MRWDGGSGGRLGVATPHTGAPVQEAGKQTSPQIAPESNSLLSII